MRHRCELNSPGEPLYSEKCLACPLYVRPRRVGILEMVTVAILTAAGLVGMMLAVGHFFDEINWFINWLCEDGIPFGCLAILGGESVVLVCSAWRLFRER